MSIRTALFFAFFLATGIVMRSSQAEPIDHDEQEEPGVRLTLFRLAAPLESDQALAPGQSPNLDRTIQQFHLRGDENFLGQHSAPYLAELEALVEVEIAGHYEFRLTCDAAATLEIDDETVLDIEHGDRTAVETIGLDDDEYLFSVRVAANTEHPRLRLEWAPPEEELAPIPTERLTAESFYFRPTNAGVKRVIDNTERPGLRQKVEGVYPSLSIATLHPPEDKVPVGGLATLSDGTLVVALFDARSLKWPRPPREPNGQLWLFYNPAGEPDEVRRELIAEELYEPAGVCVVDGSIYVSQRSEITRFDQDKNTNQWIGTTIASGWETTDFHALSFGLVHEPQPDGHPGFLYMAKGTGLGLKKNPPNHGAVWRVDLSKPSGSNVEAVSGGHRTPNGLGWGPDGTLLVTDNQGEYTPANELNVVRKGSFYGFFHEVEADAAPSPFQPDSYESDDRQQVTEAAVWLPQDEIGNSPTQPLLIPPGWLFAGQLLVGDMRYGGITRVSLEQVGGSWQGAAYRFTQGCNGGVNRLAFGPQGELYAGAIGGDHASTWSWVNPAGKKTYHGLQRLTLNGRTTFDIERVSLVPGGFEVQFTKPIDPAWLRDVSNYQLTQWTYEATPEYGGPKRDVELLQVSKATPSPDSMSVTLTVDGLKTDRVVHLLMDPTSTDGNAIWSTEVWYTVRALAQP